MKGHYEGSTLVITLDVNHEKLEAPPNAWGSQRHHYLPCRGCGEVRAVAWNVVGWTCDPCHNVSAPGTVNVPDKQGSPGV